MLDLGVNIYGGEVLSSIFFNSRFFTDLQASLLQHYVFDNTVTLSGDFEIEFRYAGNAADFASVMNSDVGDQRVFRIGTGGVISAYQPIGVLHSTTAITDGLQHHVLYTRVGQVVNLYVDDNLEATQDHANSLGDLSIDLIGERSGTYIDGILSDIKITDQGVLTHDLPINEPMTSGVIKNYGSLGDAGNATTAAITSDSAELFTQVGDDWIGEELVTQNIWENPDFVQSEWALVGNQWVLTGSGAFSLLRLIPLANQPHNMRLAGVVSGLTGELQAKNNGAALITTNGAYTFDILGVDDQSYKRASGVVNATLDKPSIKRLIEVAP